MKTRHSKHSSALSRGVTTGGKGGTIPGAELLREDRKVPTMSQVLAWIQYTCYTVWKEACTNIAWLSYSLRLVTPTVLY